MPDRAEDVLLCRAGLQPHRGAGAQPTPGTRDPPASHPPAQRELLKGRAKAGPTLEAQRSGSREPGASHMHQSQQGKIPPPPVTETAVNKPEGRQQGDAGSPVMLHAPRGMGRATYPRCSPRGSHQAETRTWPPPRRSSRARLLLPALLLIPSAAPAASRAPLRWGSEGLPSPPPHLQAETPSYPPCSACPGAFPRVRASRN